MRTVFLDRDGVINVPIAVGGKGYAPRRFCEFVLYPDTAASLRRLQIAGFQMIVATNQPDLGNAVVDSAEVERMHEWLLAALPIHEVRVCPHRQDEGCSCRKPRPGLLTAAARANGIDLSRSWMIGDRASDIAAANAVGSRGIFIDRKWVGETPKLAFAVVDSLAAAVDTVLSNATALHSEEY